MTSGSFPYRACPYNFREAAELHKFPVERCCNSIKTAEVKTDASRSFFLIVKAKSAE